MPVLIESVWCANEFYSHKRHDTLLCCRHARPMMAFGMPWIVFQSWWISKHIRDRPRRSLLYWFASRIQHLWATWCSASGLDWISSINPTVDLIGCSWLLLDKMSLPIDRCTTAIVSETDELPLPVWIHRRFNFVDLSGKAMTCD